MAEERKGAKIKKWDDVNGCPTEEVAVLNTSQATEGRNIAERSGNQMRNIEDAVEQNDNSLDGVINNLPQPDETEKARESVLQKLKEREKATEEERSKLLRVPCQAKELERDV